MLCAWWDWKGIIHKELLPPGKAINWDLYRRQLKRFKQEGEKIRPVSINRKGVVFHHDNARPHTSLVIRQILREFDLEVLMHHHIALNLHPEFFACFGFFRFL
ncbi:Mariner Mos1 transposase [Eumeta japonica]|uniref:Mariner Mos1 transposase n=1 Tax=Eumeta variegata TaxID=151549 RepID=A0A4C1Z5G9_EUMVA|nr:Mariner Mos1 transposase [Eumeta japonica]